MEFVYHLQRGDRVLAIPHPALPETEATVIRAKSGGLLLVRFDRQDGLAVVASWRLPAETKPA